MDEEVVLLEEQLAAANADIERLQSRLVDLEARAGEASELKRQIEAATRNREEQVALVRSQAEAIEAVQSERRNDAARYRELVLAHEPELPADLVSGESIAAIDEAVVSARQTVAQVRQHLEQQAQAQRVPTGAPARTGPDLSALSASEKIRIGLQGQ